MIRVTIEIWPGGSKVRAREIARMDIGNISDLAAISSYEIRASSVANPLSRNPVAFSARGTIAGHRRKDSIWALVAKATAWAADLARQSYRNEVKAVGDWMPPRPVRPSMQGHPHEATNYFGAVRPN
jgi:hypothetical protein